MPREIISTAEAPEYPTYSQAVKAGNTICVAGTTGVDVATGDTARRSCALGAPSSATPSWFTHGCRHGMSAAD